MPDLFAIISRAQFDSLAPSAQIGDRLRLDRYSSVNRALSPLAEGGALFLVTVRPPDERLWLVGILENPRLTRGAWRAAQSEAPVTDVTALRGALRFSTGAGIQAKQGSLGMSLQTPRQLTAEDLVLPSWPSQQRRWLAPGPPTTGGTGRSSAGFLPRAHGTHRARTLQARTGAA